MTSENDAWPAEVAQTVAAEVRRHRKRKGVTVQQLADMTAARYGVHLPRTVLTNFETGRRPAISVVELLALAGALDVPPALLLFPLGHTNEMEPLPGLRTSPVAALRWAIGQAELPGHPLDSDLGDRIARFLHHERLVDRWFALRDEAQQYRDYAETGPAETARPDGSLVRRGNLFQLDADLARQELAEAERRMELAAKRITEQRDVIRSDGLIPPPLPPELAELDQDEPQEGGGDEQ